MGNLSAKCFGAMHYIDNVLASDLPNGDYARLIPRLITPQVSKLCEGDIKSVIKKLRGLTMPNHNCEVIHHRGGSDADSCQYASLNPNCLHIEINGLLALLLLAEYLVVNEAASIGKNGSTTLLLQKNLLDSSVIKSPSIGPTISPLQNIIGQDLIVYAHELAERLEETFITLSSSTSPAQKPE